MLDTEISGYVYKWIVSVIRAMHKGAMTERLIGRKCYGIFGIWIRIITCRMQTFRFCF